MNTITTENKIKPGYKKTSVGIIPEDWEVKSFNECFKHLRAYTFSRNQLNYDEKEDAVYNIHYGDIHSTFPRNLLDVKKDIDLIPIIISPELETPELLKDGDLIMADASEDYEGIGQSIELINVENRQIVSGTHTFPLRPIEKFAPKYAGYIFSSYNTHKEIKRIATGISVYGISKSNIAKIQLPIPPLAEQTAIADCLSTWDSGIEKLSALITAKKEQKKGLMQGVFSGKLKVENGELVKVEDEKLWLKGWKEVRLGEVTKRVTRKNKELDDTVVTISAQRGFVLQEEYFTKRVASSTLSNYYLLHKGEFAYNKSYSKGYPMGAFKRLDDFDKAVVTTLYICFKLKDNVDSDFLLDFFEAGLMVNNLMRIAQEGGRAHGLLNIGLADFFNLQLAIPSIKEQTAIAEILQTADKEIELLEQKLESYKIQKKGLMQVLLTGERRLVES